MTTPVRGGGLRSVGASLLDQVLAETLDPAYAQAAQARAERQADAGPEVTATAGRRRWTWLRGRVLVAVVLAMGGLLAAITYNQAHVGAKGRQQVRSALIADIKNQQRVSDGLSTQLQRLQQQVSRTREQALAATEIGQSALGRLSAAEQAAAAVPVKGPGLLVTLADAKPNADGDPVGGQTTTDPRGMVQDGALQLVVNALWAAGAEAISINGERIMANSSLYCVGTTIIGNATRLSPPYVVSAIGPPDDLEAALRGSTQVEPLNQRALIYDLPIEIRKEAEVVVPPYSGSYVFHYAETGDTEP